MPGKRNSLDNSKRAGGSRKQRELPSVSRVDATERKNKIKLKGAL